MGSFPETHNDLVILASEPSMNFNNSKLAFCKLQTLTFV